MGTTATPNIGLTKPDLTEKIKDNNWVTQHTANLNILDSALKTRFDSYTPVWSANTTNPTIGSGGSITGDFVELGDGFILVWLRLDVGGIGFNAGAGNYQISLPVAKANDNENVMGSAYIDDVSVVTGSRILIPHFDNAVPGVQFFTEGFGLWTPSQPIFLAQNDGLNAFFMYPRA